MEEMTVQNLKGCITQAIDSFVQTMQPTPDLAACVECKYERRGRLDTPCICCCYNYQSQLVPKEGD